MAKTLYAYQQPIAPITINSTNVLLVSQISWSLLKVFASRKLIIVQLTALIKSVPSVSILISFQANHVFLSVPTAIKLHPEIVSNAALVTLFKSMESVS
jgi:hypothetical protein